MNVITNWQNGGPTPKGMGVRCTGCRDCEKEGHVPFRRDPNWTNSRTKEGA